MEKDGLTESILDTLKERLNTRDLDVVDKTDRNLLKVFKDVEATKDVGLTLEAFDTILKDTERNHLHPDNPEIASSTANALRELKGAERTLPKVYSPETYECIADAHITPKKTVKERPKDQVRDFLASQTARVRNECKVVSSDARVGLLNAQLSCLRTSEKEYIKLQDKAMGREPEETKKGKDENHEKKTDKTEDMEADRWEESFNGYLRRHKEEFKGMMCRAKGWQDVHEGFAEYDLEVKKHANDLVIASKANKNIYVKANLGKRFGAFQAPDNDKPANSEKKKIKEAYGPRPVTKHKEQEKLWKAYRTNRKSWGKGWKHFLYQMAMTQDPLAIAIIQGQEMLLRSLLPSQTLSSSLPSKHKRTHLPKNKTSSRSRER